MAADIALDAPIKEEVEEPKFVAVDPKVVEDAEQITDADNIPESVIEEFADSKGDE